MATLVMVVVDLILDLILIFRFGGGDSGGGSGGVASCSTSCSASGNWFVSHICSSDPGIASISTMAAGAPAFVSLFATRIVVASPASSILEAVSAYIGYAGCFLVFCPALEMIGGVVFSCNLVMRVVASVDVFAVLGAIADSSQEIDMDGYAHRLLVASNLQGVSDACGVVENIRRLGGKFSWD